MAAMRAPAPATVIPFRRGKGRQSAAVERAYDVRDDLTAHNAEALDFVDAIRPLVDRLHMVAVEIGPVAAQTVMALSAYIDRYERRHVGDGPETA